MSTMIHVEVAYALPNRQQLISLKVEAGCTAFEAAQRSGIASQFPDLDLDAAPMGVFGQAVAQPKQHVLAEGDRVEIYRPLQADPKEVRKERAAKVKAEKKAK